MHGLPSALFVELKPRYKLWFVECKATAVRHCLYVLIDFLSYLTHAGRRRGERIPRSRCVDLTSGGGNVPFSSVFQYGL